MTHVAEANLLFFFEAAAEALSLASLELALSEGIVFAFLRLIEIFGLKFVVVGLHVKLISNLTL